MGPGENWYFIENNRCVRVAEIINMTGDLCTLKFQDAPGGTRLRKTKLFKTREEAIKHLEDVTGETKRKREKMLEVYRH